MSASLSPSRSNLLALLRQAGEGPVSGAWLGERLGISRAAVWKQMAALRQAGYRIEAHRRQGYRLLGEPDPLTREAVAPLLSGSLFTPERYHFHPLLGSSNEEAARLAREAHAPEGTVVVADQQTSGRGRLARPWNSPPGVNLYFSLLLRPPIPPRFAAQLTLITGLALADAVAPLVAAVGEGLVIKWPNDLLWRGRKLAGILTEMAAEPERVGHLVVGVGINVNADIATYPPELRPLATSLAAVRGKNVGRAELLAQFLLTFQAWYEIYLSQGFPPIRDAWRQRAALAGRRVTINLARERFSGEALALDEEGFLWVRRDDGSQCRVVAGDVTLLES